MPICPQCTKENPELGAKCPRCADSYYVYDDAVAEAERDPYIGQKAADKYVVVARISEGGMGTVYRALQLPVEREVAFKVLRTELEDNDEVRNRFIREARAVSKINHPNIITLHDFGFDESDYPYMVMEYAPGQELDDWIYEDDVTLDRVVHVLRQILSALADAHDQGVVHRDLKPENIMVTGTGTDEDFIKLLDFGIARLVNEQATEGLTREGEVFGTPHYMSPEQAEGETGIGPPADVYALGIMLYEMLCAKCPFDAPKPLSILFKQINEDLPPLEPRPGMTIPQPLENVMRRATCKDPDDRYQTAGDMLEALDKIDDPERSGIVQVAQQEAGGGTQQGITDQSGPMQAQAPAAPERSPHSTPQPGQQPPQPEGREDHPSRQEMATANTLGFGDSEDGTDPPGAGTNPPGGANGNAGGVADGQGSGSAASDVSVDEPKDSLFGLEDIEEQDDQSTMIAVITVLALAFIGGFTALMMIGGEGESTAASEGVGTETGDQQAPAAANENADASGGGALAASADTGPDAGTSGNQTAGSDDPGTDTGSGSTAGARADETSDDDSTGGAAGPPDDRRADNDDSGEASEPSRESSAGSSASGSEAATGGSPSPTAGGREEEASPPPTDDREPEPSAGSTESGSSTGSGSEGDSDSETEIEKFGAPDEQDSNEPEKFGAPE